MLRERLDHHLLNEIKGLELPTLERIGAVHLRRFEGDVAGDRVGDGAARLARRILHLSEGVMAKDKTHAARACDEAAGVAG